MKITELKIVPVNEQNGLIAFASCVIDGLYVSSIAVYKRVESGYRLVFPAKKHENRLVFYCRPVTQEVGTALEQAIAAKCRELFGDDNQRPF